MKIIRVGESLTFAPNETRGLLKLKENEIRHHAGSPLRSQAEFLDGSALTLAWQKI